MSVRFGTAPAAARASHLRLFEPAIVRRALVDSIRKLDPRSLVRNPIVFSIEVGAALVTVRAVRDLVAGRPVAFSAAIAVGLWLTVLAANFAEAMAEDRGKAHAEALRRARQDLIARRMTESGLEETIPASGLTLGDLIVVRVGDLIPADGDVIEGVATVDESAITGESAPVIREAGGDRSGVTAGTKVLSDWIKVRVTAEPGRSFLDRVIAMVEGAERQRTPGEIVLTILLVAFTVMFLATVITLQPFAIYAGPRLSDAVLVALFVALIPSTIGGLIFAVGIAGMDRLVRRNVLAMSARAVEAAGDVATLLLDKTGTITLGNREAVTLIPAPGVTDEELADAAQLASLADETPEGRSIVVLTKERYGLRGRDLLEARARLVPFSAHTRMSGVDIDGVEIRKGAVDAIIGWVGQAVHGEVMREIERIGAAGETPLLVAKDHVILGIIELKDVVKEGLAERFEELRRMGIRTVMITGDNVLTAGAIAQEAGVDDFLAEATPEDKLALIEREQRGGRMVAMTGDGTNDAPALAKADVGVAMNAGSAAAIEAGNMVDLDSSPTKLIDIVEVGKEFLITRGALTTFSVASDLSKYVVILPAMFVGSYPILEELNVMALRTPESAILSAIIFNALIIVALVPVALRGVRWRAVGAQGLLRRNLLVYGIGGLIAPFLGIKLIDLLLGLVGLP